MNELYIVYKLRFLLVCGASGVWCKTMPPLDEQIQVVWELRWLWREKSPYEIILHEKLKK